MSNVRFSVPVSKAADDVFARIAAASGVSKGKCIAAWLDDTLDAAEFMANKMDAARQSPRILSRELHTYAAGLAGAVDSVIGRAKSGKTGGLTPPSSNTGGKVFENTPKKADGRGGFSQ
jgi:hypothetical protein